MRICNDRRWGKARLATVCLLLLAGCASTPRVDIASDPNAEFGRYETFTFHEPLHTDRESGVGTVLSQLLRSLTLVEMERRGYEYVERDADLEINFFVENREKIESYPDPARGMHYGYWNHPYGVWSGYGSERIRQYTIGTLHLDIVDLARKQLVWEAIAVDRVKTDFSYEQDDVRKAMVEMFAGFPARAAPTR
jgi:hypothetical protein